MFRSALSNFVSNITQSSPKLLTEDDKRNLRSTSLFPSIAAETIVEATDNNTREALVPVKYFKDNSPDRQEELNRLDTFDVASLSEDVMHVFKTTEPTHPVEVSDFGGNASAREKEVKLIHNRSVFNNTTYPSTDRPLRSPLPSDVGFDTELDLHPYADATDKAKYTQNVIKAAASRGHLPDAKTFVRF
jgi:hypothetical protein